MGTLLLLLTIALLSVQTFVNSEMANFPVESSELCANVGSPDVASASNSIDRLEFVYRYHNESGQCYKVGEKGPCGELMIFYADPTNGDYGDCDCDQSLRCHRPLLYEPEQRRCYLAFEQGPCASNEWLTLEFRTPRCEVNPCTRRPNTTSEFDDEVQQTNVDFVDGDHSEFWFHSEETGECYKTNTQGFCTFPNEVAIFNGFDSKIKPRCTTIETRCILPKVPTLFCAPGQKWSTNGLCQLKPKCTRHRDRSGGKRHRYHWASRAHNHQHRNPFNKHNHNFGRQNWLWNSQQEPRFLNNSSAAWSATAQNELNDTVPNNTRWGQGNHNHHHRPAHHHHFHNHSSVGPQWKRNSQLKRASSSRTHGLQPRSRTNSNYMELSRVDFLNNGDEYLAVEGENAELGPVSSEKK